MDLFGGACVVISTLVIVIPILWGALAATRKQIEKQMARAEATCRGDLERERQARIAEQKDRAKERESDQGQMRNLEQDVRTLLTAEIAKSSAALVYVGSKLAELADSHDDLRDHVGLPPRPKDPQRSTTVQIVALTGGKPR